MNIEIEEMRARIARMGALMFDRFLTDTAGGNISARVGDLVCMTPAYAAAKYHWRITPQQVLVVDLKGNKLEGEGQISREAKVHLRLYNDYPDGKGIVHAHARNVMVFCAARQPIPPVTEATHKFGTIKVARFAPSHTNELADYVSEAFQGQEGRVRKQAAAVLGAWHGLFVLGKDLEAAFDAAERIDVNARCILLRGALEQGLKGIDTWSAALDADVAGDK